MEGQVINIDQTGSSVTGIEDKPETGSDVRFEARLNDLQASGGSPSLLGKARWKSNAGEKSAVGIQIVQLNSLLDQWLRPELEDVNILRRSTRAPPALPQ